MKFELSKTQWDLLHEWIENHTDDKNKICADKYAGAIGGAFKYMFTPTSIGTIVKVECSWCKQIKDVSDYEDW
jgi:hypothetical protein